MKSRAERPNYFEKTKKFIFKKAKFVSSSAGGFGANDVPLVLTRLLYNKHTQSKAGSRCRLLLDTQYSAVYSREYVRETRERETYTVYIAYRKRPKMSREEQVPS